MRISFDPHTCWDVGMILSFCLFIVTLAAGSALCWVALAFMAGGLHALFDPEPWGGREND